MNVFLDTNALVKLYHLESGSESLEKFLYESGNINILISEIAVIEFHSAFMKKLRLKEIEYKNVKSLFEIFDNSIKYFSVIEVNKSLLELSVQLIDKYSQRFTLNTLDSIQLSSAIFSNQINPVSKFITSDLNLIEVANHFFDIFNPED